MCGIYGVVNKKVDRELAMKCLNTMIHRGPDGYGPVSYTQLTLPTT